MKVAVLGGGPSGAYTAELLATAGVDTTLFDEKLAWEKPCGGGLTWKAYTEYPFLADSPAARKTVTETVISAPGTAPVRFPLDRPLLIYSRRELNGMMLDRASSAGAAIEQTRVLGVDRTSRGWLVRTKQGIAEADFCVVALGARNNLRHFGTALTAADTMSALGYYVPGERERIDIVFLEALDGYIWVFPRCGHMSVGICGKGESAATLRSRLDRYMDQHALPRDGATFYSHLLPAISEAAWTTNTIAGDGWVAVGDAAGLVDPITGEGIYYAIRSADIAARTILSAPPAATADAYATTIRADFGDDLAYASHLSARLFHGSLLGGPVPTRMVQLTRRSPAFRQIVCDLFSGTQPYLGLKRRLNGSLARTIAEAAASMIRAN